MPELTRAGRLELELLKENNRSQEKLEKIKAWRETRKFSIAGLIIVGQSYVVKVLAASVPWLAIGLAFLGGFIAGGIVTYAIVKIRSARHLRRPMPGRPDSPPENVPEEPDHVAT